MAFGITPIPSKQFAEGEVITTSALNQLPIITLTIIPGTALQLLRTNAAVSDGEWFTPTYVGSETAIPADPVGTATATAHGLAVVPTVVQVCAVAQATDSGYASGDIIPLESFVNVAAPYQPAFVVFKDATNITVRKLVAAADIRMANKTTGAIATPTMSNWKFKIYAVALSA